jgi:uncharacterized protein YdeI (YjbR/CyaY-like superfamily)
MSKRDPRVDDYIDHAEPFARPILTHLREVVHAASPDIEETIKWRFPNFVKDGIVCHMAAFKRHCSFGFWKGALIVERDPSREPAMGQFGRITSLDDLPPTETIIGYVQEAVRLNEEGVKAPRATAGRAAEAPLDEAFRRALDAHPEAGEAFERFTPGQRREYAAWIAEARRDETRANRIDTAIEWIAEGKPRNWKYMKSRR